MADKTLADIAKDMRHIDIAILSTVTPGGAIAGRPMSNNNLVLTWVAVTDVRGRERLEAQWIAAPQGHAPHVTHAA